MNNQLAFLKVGSTGKTGIFQVCNRKDYVLGLVKWYAPWRRYCFFCDAGYIFDSSCLKEITEFIDRQMTLRDKVKMEARQIQFEIDNERS